jgi:lipopolysaccharide export system protein LptC
MTPSGLLDRLRAWLPLLPLLLLLAGVYWLSQQVRPLPVKPDASKRHDPDYIVSNFSATTLNEQGVPRYVVNAQRMEHYPDDDSTHLEEPRLTSLYSGHPPLHISASHGEISRNGEEVFLRDDVKIVRDATATQSELVVTTTYLHVLPDSEQADTDRPITMVEAHNVIDAVGMELNNKAREIKLLGQVRSQFEPAND